VALPERFLTVREIGDGRWSYWLPASMDGSSVLLDPGENILATRVGTVRGRLSPGGQVAWTESPTGLVISDRRVIYFRTDFEKGGGWVGFSAGGLAVATVANIASKRAAAKKTAGKVSIGHVRYEWVQSAAYARSGQSQREVPHLAFGVGAAAGVQTVELCGLDQAFCTWLGQVIAGHRLALDDASDSPGRNRLEAYHAGSPDPILAPGVVGVSWQFPGDTRVLIEKALTWYSPR
jgi:hypothetical protein